jgi:hypothetical protein
MRELEGRSYAEIAEIMGTSVSAVETVLFRARRALREQLEGTLSCAEAEFFLSKQSDGELARGERGQLRAHLRECPECETLARQQRASRGALKALLGGVPLPASLWGGSGLTFGLGAKAAAIVCAGAVVGTGGYEAAKEVHVHAVAAAKSAQTDERSSTSSTNVRAVRAAVPVALAHVAAARHLAKPQAKAAHPNSAVKRHQRATGVHTLPPTAAPPAQANAAAHRAHPTHPVHPAHPVAKPHPAKTKAAKPKPAKPHPAKPKKPRKPTTATNPAKPGHVHSKK